VGLIFGRSDFACQWIFCFERKGIAMWLGKELGVAAALFRKRNLGTPYSYPLPTASGPLCSRAGAGLGQPEKGTPCLVGGHRALEGPQEPLQARDLAVQVRVIGICSWGARHDGPSPGSTAPGSGPGARCRLSRDGGFLPARAGVEYSSDRPQLSRGMADLRVGRSELPENLGLRQLRPDLPYPSCPIPHQGQLF